MVVLKTLLGLGIMVGVVFGVVFGVYKLARLLTRLLGDDIDDYEFGDKALVCFLTVILILGITIICGVAYMLGNSITG
mgnify:CR=1 FL=1|tara:strand:+ start:1347 stop:1580 length:234 start_codon:yes stop_codon:yes gene_type:complete